MTETQQQQINKLQAQIDKLQDEINLRHVDIYAINDKIDKILLSNSTDIVGKCYKSTENENDIDVFKILKFIDEDSTPSNKYYLYLSIYIYNDMPEISVRTGNYRELIMNDIKEITVEEFDIIYNDTINKLADIKTNSYCVN